MKRKSAIFSLSAVGIALILTSCQYDKDPNLEWKNAAKEAYKKFYSSEEGKNLAKDPLFYFDPETLKGVLVRDENTVDYLGQLNFSNFTFSENPNKYYVDFGNIPITLNDTNDDGQPDNFTFGDYIYQNESGETTFDVKALVNNLPFVLHEYDTNWTEVKTYSMVNKDGAILETSNAKAYDPNFFFISDFNMKIDGFDQFSDDLLNFTGQDMAFLRNDLYTIIGNLLKSADLEKVDQFLGLSNTLKQTYRKAVGIPSDQNMPSSLVIPGEHYRNFDEKRQVVVGPISFIPELLGHFLPNLDQGDTNPSVYDVETIVVSEGIETISFFAFAGERDSETGASKSKVKNVYLPSTLNDIQFNAFSDLDLENIYVPKTYEMVDNQKVESSISTVDFGDADFSLESDSDTLEIQVKPSFGNTNINNLYFEDYSNKNIKEFPYSNTNLADIDTQKEAIKIYHGDFDTTKFTSLDEAFKTYETVNPFYQIELTADENKRYKLKSDLTNIAKGKKLYLPYFEYSLDDKTDARSLNTSNSSENVSTEKNENEAKITLELTKDLVIDGSLIVGAQIGVSKLGSGDIAGEFASINLNGHTITINNGGSIEGNGLIYDSTGKGKIVVKTGGKLFTNTALANYKDFSEVERRINGGANLFDSYKFSSLKVEATFEAGSIFETSFDYASTNLINENRIKFIGSDDSSLIKLESGEIKVNKGSINGANSKVTINDFNLLTIEDLSASSVSTDKEIAYKASEFGFNLANDLMKVDLGEVNLNTYLRSESGNLTLNTLTLNNGAKIYSKDASNFVVSGGIKVAETTEKSAIIGQFKTNNNDIFNSYVDLVSGENENKMSYRENVVSLDSDGNILNNILNVYAIEGSSLENFTNLLYKNELGYYYTYKNSYESGQLKANQNDETLASYEGSTDWVAQKVDEENDFPTGVSSDNRVISSFSDSTGTTDYVLNIQNASWDKISDAENGIYTIGKSSNKSMYIKTSAQSSLIKGSYYTSNPSETAKLFVSDADGSIYVRESYEENADPDNWMKVEVFDKANVLKTSDNTYLALLDGANYTEADSYNASTHMLKKGDTNYAYVKEEVSEAETFRYVELGSEIKLNPENKSLKSQDSSYIYLDSQSSWMKVHSFDDNLASKDENNSSYFFKVNKEWLESVSGNDALTYNELADSSFGVLKDRYSYNGQRYKFIMRNGDSSEGNTSKFELFAPQALVEVSKEDFEDMWPENTSEDYFHAYRHIEKLDGKKCLYFLNDEGKIELREFEFAASFTPSDPVPGETNIVNKYNFIIYKVRFYVNGVLEDNVRTLYINVDSSNDDNAIYAGNATDTTSDDYLGLAVFTTKNPINSITE